MATSLRLVLAAGSGVFVETATGAIRSGVELGNCYPLASVNSEDTVDDDPLVVFNHLKLDAEDVERSDAVNGGIERITESQRATGEFVVEPRRSRGEAGAITSDEP